MIERSTARLRFSGRFTSWLATSSLAFFSQACQCEEERPYTPFAVATSLPSTSPDDRAPTAPESPATEEPVTAQLAPPGTSTWTVFSRTLVAPPESVLSSALRLEKSDIVAWVSPKKPTGGNGGLWLFDEQGHATRRLTSVPDYLPSGPDCAEEVTLVAASPSSVAVEIVRTCSTRQLPGAPTRALLFVQPSREAAVTFGLRLSDLPPGETLRLTPDATDRDGDGSDDYRVGFELKSPAGEVESWSLSWIGRPAGPSREKDAPSSEFAKRAARLVIGGQRKAERARVPAQVDALRRLFSAVCSESASARIKLLDGSPLVCGDVSASLGSLVTAAVHAHLGLKEIGRAVGEAERAAWYGERVKDSVYGELEKLLLARISNAEVEAPVSVRAEARAPKGEVTLLPLAFDDAGRLWSLGNEPRWIWPTPPPAPFAPPAEGQEESPAPAPPAPPTLPTSPADKRLTHVLPSCDRAEVQLAFSDREGAPLPPAPLPLLAPRPGQCRADFGGGPLPARLLGWFGGEPAVLVAGEIFGSRARGEDATSVVSTRFGLLVERKGNHELWRGARSTGLDCVVDASGQHAACLEGAAVKIWTRPAGLDAKP